MASSARLGTFSEEDLERYVRVWSEPGALPAMVGWYRALFRRAGELYRHSARIPPYRMQALLLWGEQDVALGVELAEASARLLAQGQLIRVPTATHWVQHDFPDLTTQHILDNLRRG
jgi:pimeloyl-ACP methyl ester carboxylesterase